jgi:hypothetical protein
VSVTAPTFLVNGGPVDCLTIPDQKSFLVAKLPAGAVSAVDLLIDAGGGLTGAANATWFREVDRQCWIARGARILATTSNTTHDTLVEAERRAAEIRTRPSPTPFQPPLSQSGVTVRVSGTAGIAFTGSCLSVNASGSRSATVEGAVPAQYEYGGTIVSCVFQKQGVGGTLTAQITAGGQTLVEDSTSAPFGVVSVAANR